MNNAMSRSKRLSPVLKLAENKEKTAALAMARARQQLHYYENKVNQLRAYRDEYSQSLIQGRAKSMSAIQLQEYQNFIRQLNEGITLLSKKIEEQKSMTLQDEKSWISAKSRTDVLDKLVLKLNWMDKKFHNNREANEMDDRSQHSKKKI